MIKLYLAIIGFFISGIIYGQESQITYKVTDYALNGENYDYIALKNDVALTFYHCDENTICFANHWRKVILNLMVRYMQSNIENFQRQKIRIKLWRQNSPGNIPIRMMVNQEKLPLHLPIFILATP